MDIKTKLGKSHIPGLLAHFAVPSVLSLLLHAFYNIADRIFIGRGVGALGLTGVTFCFPIMLLIFGVSMLFSSGCAFLISIYLGQNDIAKAEKTLGVTFSYITLIGIALIVLGQLYYRNILSLFNVPLDVMPHAGPYLKIMLSGSLLFLFGFTVCFVIRAEGNPLYATAAIVIGTVINLILDPIFIFIFSMGTLGAALATVISEGAVVFIGLIYLFRKKGIVHIRRKYIRFDLGTLKDISIVGASSALNSAAGSIQCILLNSRLLILGGNIAVAAMGIIFPFWSMIRLFTAGMAGGMQPIIGYNYGAGNMDRVKSTFYYALKVSVAVIFFFALALVLFANNVVGFFAKDNQQLTTMGAYAMRIFFCMAPLSVIHLLGMRYFQAIGKGPQSMVVGLLREIAVFIPTLFILSNAFSLNGVWFSSPVTDIISSAVIFFIIHKHMQNIKAK